MTMIKARSINRKSSRMPIETFSNQCSGARRELLPVFHCCADEWPSDKFPVVSSLGSQKIFEEVILRLSVFCEIADVYWRGERLLPVDNLAF